MTLWDRLSRLVRANLNDLLRRAEDPEKIIEQALLDMKQALREAREQVAEALAEQKRLEREVESGKRPSGRRRPGRPRRRAARTSPGRR